MKHKDREKEAKAVAFVETSASKGG